MPTPLSELLDEHDRAWLDWRWCWLAERIGTDRIRAAEVYGSMQAFIATNSPISTEAMQTLAEKIAGMLGIADLAVRVVIGANETVDDEKQFLDAIETAKLDPHAIVIPVNIASLEDPQVTAFFAMKQIIADYLILKGWLDPDAPDGGEVSELAAVQLGVGIILANNVNVQENVTYVGVEWGRSFAGTMLSEELLTYAMARFAFLRHETPPDWQRGLRGDPRETFKQCLAEFEVSPPPERMQEPEGVMSPHQWATAKQEEADAEDWADEELAPSNEQDFADDKGSPVYCKSCAYDVASLPAGDCPECGKPFDPEDLRTVTLERPKVYSESAHQRLALLKRMSPWLIIATLVLIVFVLYLFSIL